MGIAFNGSNQKLRWAGQIVTAYPFTMACWARSPGGTPSGSSFILEAGDDATGQNRFDLYYSGSSNKYIGATTNGGTGFAYSSPQATTATTWEPMLYVATSATSHTFFYGADPSSQAADTTSTGTFTFSNLTSVRVGTYGGDALFWSGEVAEVTFWSVALSGSDWVTFQGGALPESIQSGSVVEQWPLLTATSLTGLNARTFTASNSPTTSGTHPITRSGGGGGSNSVRNLIML